MSYATTRFKQACFAADPKQRCYLCGERLSYKKATVDHFLPRAHGGTNHWKNLRICCYDCNQNKADLIIEPTEATKPKKVKYKRRMQREKVQTY